MREKYLFIGIVFNLILSLEKKSCKNLDSCILDIGKVPQHSYIILLGIFSQKFQYKYKTFVH